MTIPLKVMRGVVLTGHGETDKLKYCENLTVPSPKDYEVLIRVFAAGVNNTDLNTRTAWYSKSDNGSEDASWNGNSIKFPRIQGADVCGEIIAVGKYVDPNRIGERVLIEPCITQYNGSKLDVPWYFGSECDGGFAEYTTVSERHAYKVNSTLSHAELASFPCSYSTAENMLTRANVTKGDRVLISGASGGVGSAAIQLAKARGAEVVAIASPSKKTQVFDVGADIFVSRNAQLIENLKPNSIDVVIDLVAGQQWPQFLDVLKPGGRYAVSGAIGGAMVELDVRTLYLKDLNFYGCTVLEPNVFQNLITKIEQGKVKPLIAKSFPLKELVEAQTYFMQKSFVGKVVIAVS